MLTTAHELYKKGSQRANRLIYHIGALLGRERLAGEDVDSAQKLLESVAGAHSQVVPHTHWIRLGFEGLGFRTLETQRGGEGKGGRGGEGRSPSIISHRFPTLTIQTAKIP